MSRYLDSVVEGQLIELPAIQKISDNALIERIAVLVLIMSDFGYYEEEIPDNH